MRWCHWCVALALLLALSRAQACRVSFTQPTRDQVFFSNTTTGDVFFRWSVACSPGTEAVRKFTFNGRAVEVPDGNEVQINSPTGGHIVAITLVDARNPSVELGMGYVRFSIWRLDPNFEMEMIPRKLLSEFAARGYRFSNLLPPIKPVVDPLLSIIYVTYRPGGYDILLHSLAHQTDQRYELIIVDELSPQRYAAVTGMAQRLGVNLKFLTVSKEQRPEIKAMQKGEKKFGGMFNACNTGLLASSAPIVSLQMDFSWLAPNFVERTVKFFEKHPKALLGYPCHNFKPKNVEWAKVQDPSATSIFTSPVEVSPLEAGFEWSLDPKCFDTVHHSWMEESDGYVRASTLKGFWDGVAFTMPWTIMEALNGMDELLLSLGDDAGNNNLWFRAASAGVEEWVDSRVWLQSVENRAISDDLNWNRVSTNSNFQRVIQNLYAIGAGNATLRAPNNFDLRSDRGRPDLTGPPVQQQRAEL